MTETVRGWKRIGPDILVDKGVVVQGWLIW